MKIAAYLKSKNLMDSIKKSKSGWFTMLFYAIGNIFWAYANNFRKIAGTRSGINHNISNVIGGFWITIIREFLYLVLLFVYTGPGLFKKGIKDLFTKGGKWMLLAVFCNFLGNVLLSIGYVYLVTAAFAGTIETSFLLFNFIGGYILFKNKYSKKTIIGLFVMVSFLIGTTLVQLFHNGVSGEISQSIIGCAFVMIAQFGYIAKNMISEYVFKKKYLETESVQFLATFLSFFVALVSTIIIIPILEPIIVATTNTGGPLISAAPWKLFIFILKMWQVPLLVLIASAFLVTGRNFQYFTIRVSGGAMGEVYNKSKLLVQNILTILGYVILIGITKSVYPVLDTNHLSAAQQVLKHDPWLLITSSKFTFFSLWYYWVLLVGLLISVAYVTITAQPKYEESQKIYRENKEVDESEEDYVYQRKMSIRKKSKELNMEDKNKEINDIE